MRHIRDRQTTRRARWLAALVLGAALLSPVESGYQDLGALIARQPAVAERTRAYVFGSAGTLHAAAFGFWRPTVSALPVPQVILTALDPTGETPPDTLIDRMIGTPRDDEDSAPPSPEINRAAKADRIGPASGPVNVVPLASADSGDSFEAVRRLASLGDSDADTDIAMATAAVGASMMDTARLYFGADPLAVSAGAIHSWNSGEAPVVVRPTSPQVAKDQSTPDKPGTSRKARKSPAERLGLTGKARAKAEKCLAEAVYFESRGEQVRGQIAVAQVVMNRVFYPFYPKTVCGVVYQNARRHLACQFTFACDGIRDVVTEPDAWERAKTIAKETLDGQLWLAEVGKATHYHAYWVRPSWVREMKRLYKFGVHSFYRPRAWGSGADEPRWGDAAATLEAVKSL